MKNIPWKRSAGSTPSRLQTSTNQATPTATWPTSSSAMRLVILALRVSPFPTSLSNSLGPASNPRASYVAPLNRSAHFIYMQKLHTIQ